MTTRSAVGAYVQLPDFITDSDEYKAMPYGARAVLVELLKTVTKEGNGAMTMTASQAKRAGIDIKTRRKGLEELQKAGIIVRTQRHSFPHHPDRYAIFWRGMAIKNGTPVSMSIEEFEQWSMEQKRHFKQYAVGNIPLFADVPDDAEKMPVGKNTTVEGEKIPLCERQKTACG